MNPQIPDVPPAPQTLDQKYFRWFADTKLDRAVKVPGTHEGQPIYGPTSLQQIQATPYNFAENWKQSDPNDGYASHVSSQSTGNEPEDDWTEFLEHPKGDETYESNLGQRVILYEEEKQFLRTDLMQDFHFGRLLRVGSIGHSVTVMKVLAHCRSTQFDEWPTKNGKPVYRELAMKVIRHQYYPGLVEKKLLKSPEEALSEFENLRYLRHENIVNIKDIIKIPGQTHNVFPYAAISIFMEYCDGELHDILEEEKPRRYKVKFPQMAPEHTTKHWFRHVMLGIEYLHRMGVTLTNLRHTETGRPHNILYVYRGRGVNLKDATLEQKVLQSNFKISDFGLSEERPYTNYSRKEMFEDNRLWDLKDMVDMVNEHIISEGSRCIYGKNKGNILDSPANPFMDYCKTGELKGELKRDYYEEWKQLSPEFLRFFAKFQRFKFEEFKNVTAPELAAIEILTDPWVDTDGQIRKKLVEESGPIPGSTDSAGTQPEDEWGDFQSFDQLFSTPQQLPQDPVSEPEDEWGDSQSFDQ